MNKIFAVLSIFSLGLLVSCGGGGGGGGGQVHVAVSPTSASVIAGQTQNFTATVTGALNAGVTWSVSCSTSTCGSIDSNGLYTAPALIPSSATVTVKATSQEDTNITGTASVTQNPVSIAVTPNSTQTLISADTKQFSATVSNAPSGHATYTWSVTGGGTVDNSGLYTAPSKVTADTTVTVTAKSDFDNTKVASININLKAPVITLSPGDQTMEAGAQLRFTATVTNVPAGQDGITWALNGDGTLISGNYSAPDLVAADTTSSIQAVSVFDNTKAAHSVVTIHPVTIGVLPKTATLYPEQTKQFTAAVANHVNKTVTWSVSGVSCSGASCGAVDSNGLYTAPASISDQMDVMVAVTSIADTSKADTAIVTLKPLTVTVSPKTATVKVGLTQQFSATVQGGSNLNVTWGVSGTGCSGGTCGTIDTSGLYTAPGTVPTPATVTVTATSVADSSRNDTATVTIVYDPNVKLNGAFAFTFTGWDTNGAPLDAIGSMVADGNGHLTGLLDMNGLNATGHTYHAIKQSFTGTYQVNAGDNRGVMTITTTETFNFRFAMSSTGDRGQILLFESSGRYGAGWFKKQTTSDFSLAKLNGDYVMGLSGLSVMGDERNVAIARSHVDGSGGISNTSLDVSNTNGPTAHTTFTGSATMSADTGMSSGRGTFTISAQGTTINLSFYMVNAGEGFLMVSDTVGSNAPLLIGRFLKQTGEPYSAASFTGQVVMYMTGIVPTTTPIRTLAHIARYSVVNGSGNGAVVENYGGQLPNTSGSIFANIDATGRATIAMGWTSASFVAYFVAPNTGFIMEYDTPNGMAMRFGFFEQQNASIANSDLSGEFFGGVTDPGTSGVGYGNGIQTYDGNGAWSGVGNTIGPGSGQYPDVSVGGTYTIVDNTGRGNWQGTYPGTYNKIFYAISPSKIVFIPAETSNTYPALEVFEK